MSPTTHMDGKVIEHDGDTPPADVVNPANPQGEPTPPGEQVVENELDAQKDTRRPSRPRPKKTAAVKKAEAQRRKRVAKRK